MYYPTLTLQDDRRKASIAASRTSIGLAFRAIQLLTVVAAESVCPKFPKARKVTITL